MNDTRYPSSDARRASRREFAKHSLAAVTSAATLCAPRAVCAQNPPPREATAPPNPQPSPTPQPAPDRLLDAYTEVARARFGGQLDAAELGRVRDDLTSYLRTSARLRDAKLKNSDEPDFIFKA